jgi:hypothetical protein
VKKKVGRNDKINRSLLYMFVRIQEELKAATFQIEYGVFLFFSLSLLKQIMIYFCGNSSTNQR